MRLTRLGFFISAGTAGFMGCFGLLYAFMGAMMKTIVPSNGGRDAPPPELFWFVIGFGLLFTTIGFALAATRLYAAKCIRQRWRVYCLLVAASTCVEVPYGTAFGILAIVLLARPSVRAMFGD